MSRTAIWSVTVAVAGFLFGFDTVVISGANEPIKAIWNTSGWFHGTFIMSMALWGTVLGALLGGIPCDRFGRKKTLFWIGVLYLASALGSAMAPEPYTFSLFRFIGGVGVGASSVAAPTHISEISSSRTRGRLVALYQFNIVLGIMIAFISNYLLDGVGGINDWRWMLGVEAIPAAIYTALILSVPNSPRWLVLKKGQTEKAKDVLRLICETEQEVDETCRQMLHDQRVDDSAEKIFQRKFRKPLVLAFLLAFFNQLSGINFVLYYAPVILEKAGFASSESLLSSVSIGGVNILFTFFGVYLIDRIGRRQLMYIGSFGYILSLGMVAYGFKTEANATFSLAFILLFIASHAIGQGAVIWVYIAEIFPNQVRAAGQSFGTGVHWVFAALVTLLGEVVISAFPPWTVFAFFAAFMVLQLTFTHFVMPETKGRSLEELEREMVSP